MLQQGRHYLVVGAPGCRSGGSCTRDSGRARRSARQAPAVAALPWLATMHSQRNNHAKNIGAPPQTPPPPPHPVPLGRYLATASTWAPCVASCAGKKAGTVVSGRQTRTVGCIVHPLLPSTAAAPVLRPYCSPPASWNLTKIGTGTDVCSFDGGCRSYRSVCCKAGCGGSIWTASMQDCTDLKLRIPSAYAPAGCAGHHTSTAPRLAALLPDPPRPSSPSLLSGHPTATIGTRHSSQ